MYKKQPPPPHLEPTQSMKFINVKGPVFIDNLVFNQSEKTKEAFSLCKDSTPSLKAILFLAFQIDQNMHKGPSIHNFSCSSLHTLHPCNFKRKHSSTPQSPPPNHWAT